MKCGGGRGGGAGGAAGGAGGATHKCLGFLQSQRHGRKNIRQHRALSDGAEYRRVDQRQHRHRHALACIPGIGYHNAPAVLAYRQANSGRMGSDFVAQGSSGQNYGTTAITNAGALGDFQSFQFTADIAAVGHTGAATAGCGLYLIAAADSRRLFIGKT